MTKKEILHLLDHHKRKVISVIILVICFCLIAVGAKHGAKKADPLYGARVSYKEATGDNALNELITSYYKAYYSNDKEALEEIVYPIGALEESYIQFMSEYVEGCEVVEIFSKPGRTPDSYLVSVNANVKFKGVDDLSPGLDFFYVSTDHKGNLYIDNTYTASIGGQDPDLDKDESVVALIEEFEEQEDVVMLRLSIKNQYKELIDSSDSFRSFVGETLPNAINQWYSDYNAELEATRAEEEAAKAAEEENEVAATESNEAAEPEAPVEEPTEEQEEPQAPAAPPIPEGGYAAGSEVSVTDILNIREQPDVNSTKIGTVLNGGVVKVLENSGENGWTKIEYNGKTGFIRTDVLR